MLHHIKYQLLIQRLILFFYPMVAQIPLQQGLFWTFSRKGILRRFHFSLCKQARKAKLLSAPVFFTPPGQDDVFLIFVKSFRSVNMRLSHRLHQLEQQLFCLSVSVLHFEKSSCCSEVKASPLFCQKRIEQA